MRKGNKFFKTTTTNKKETKQEILLDNIENLWAHL